MQYFSVISPYSCFIPEKAFNGLSPDKTLTNSPMSPASLEAMKAITKTFFQEIIPFDDENYERTYDAFYVQFKHLNDHQRLFLFLQEQITYASSSSFRKSILVKNLARRYRFWTVDSRSLTRGNFHFIDLIRYHVLQCKSFIHKNSFENYLSPVERFELDILADLIKDLPLEVKFSLCNQMHFYGYSILRGSNVYKNDKEELRNFHRHPQHIARLQIAYHKSCVQAYMHCLKSFLLNALKCVLGITAGSAFFIFWIALGAGVGVFAGGGIVILMSIFSLVAKFIVQCIGGIYLREIWSTPETFAEKTFEILSSLQEASSDSFTDIIQEHVEFLSIVLPYTLYLLKFLLLILSIVFLATSIAYLGYHILQIYLWQQNQGV